MDYGKESIKKHFEKNGKLKICLNMDIENKEDLSIAYTPGVAKVCEKIVDTEYSTGSGDKVIQYIELGYYDKNGNYIKYIDRIASIGGFFEMGRFTNPDKIIFKKWDKDDLQCK